MKPHSVHKQNLPIVIRPFSTNDTEVICSWVSSANHLAMISGEKNSHLTPTILDRWIHDSIQAITLLYKKRPVGFCTLSNTEHPHPITHVELCHFVISPKHRRRYFGTNLLNYMRLLAAHHGFRAMRGRIERSNHYALSFAEYVHWISDSDPELPNDFRWYCYDIKALQSI